MTKLHSQLTRQIKRIFGGQDAVPEKVLEFIDLVNERYQESDDDRKMLERSLELSSEELLQANQDMKNSLSLLQATLNSTSNGILVVKHTGALSYNRKFLAMWQIPEKELDTYTNEEIIQLIVKPLQDPQTFLERMLEVNSRATSQSYNNIHFIDGRVMEWYSAPQYVDGHCVRCVWSFSDITRLIEAENEQRQQKEFFRKVIDSNPNLIFVKDWQGKFKLANRALADMYGTTVEDVVGKTDADFSTDSEQIKEYVKADHQVLESGVPTFIAEESLTDSRTGQKRWFQTTKIPLNSALREAGEVLGISSDITERKEFEEAQAKLVQKLEEANRAKNQFLANISHEVRTPMNGVYGMLELALETNLSDEQVDLLETAKSSAIDMLTIINDILDYSKIEAAKLVLDTIEFDLHDAVKSVLKQLSFSAQSKGLALIFGMAPNVPNRVIGDPARLKQILTNLLSNAVKFTHEGEVVLRVWRGRSQADHACIHFAVTDTGIGLPPEKKQIIFEAFSQADGSTTRKYGGTGLGLTISSLLAKKMGGDIWVNSPPDPESIIEFNRFISNDAEDIPPGPANALIDKLGGPGSTFHFTALVEELSEVVGVDQMKPVAKLKGMRVLVVESNQTSAGILLHLLSKFGMRPTLVSDSRATLRHLGKAVKSKERCQLVIIGSQMADIDGIMLAKSIGRKKQLSGIPIIMLTSVIKQPSPEALKEAGILASISKPVFRDDLVQVLLNLSSSRHTAKPSRKNTRDVERTEKAHRLEILVAEDNVVNQKLARRLLEKLNHEVVLVGNGQEALNMQQEGKFDLIFMDIHMPEMDGLTATRLIREQEKQTGRHIPIIALTANAMNGDRERFLEAGMDEYVSKPIRKAALVEVIEKLAPIAKSSP